MAQTVGYFEDNIEYREGPFVIVPLYGTYRIEVEFKGHKCPITTDISIYRWRESIGRARSLGRDKAADVCDKLNQLVKDEVVVLKDGIWVHPEFDKA